MVLALTFCVLLVSVRLLPGSCDGPLPFGFTQGIAHGVPALSNGDSDIITSTYNWVVVGVSWCGQTPSHVMVDPFSEVDSSSSGRTDVRSTMGDTACSPMIEAYVYSGMRWQCVEYARRFLITTAAVTFGDVLGAEDIWSLSSFAMPEALRPPPEVIGGGDDADVASDGTVPIVKFHASNCSTDGGPSTSPGDVWVPLTGDVIIWHRQLDMPYGHVAVVVDAPFANDTSLRGDASCRHFAVPIGEQNFAASSWPAAPVAGVSRHARALTLSICGSGSSEVSTLSDPTGYTLIGAIRPVVAARQGQ